MFSILQYAHILVTFYYIIFFSFSHTSYLCSPNSVRTATSAVQHGVLRADLLRAAGQTAPCASATTSPCVHLLIQITKRIVIIKLHIICFNITQTTILMFIWFIFHIDYYNPKRDIFAFYRYMYVVVL